MATFLRQHEAITDRQLRTTVKLLGTLLGKVIRTHAGKDVYNAVLRVMKEIEERAKFNSSPAV